MSKQPNPTSTWRAAVAKARENTDSHWSSGEIEAVLWREGFGSTAAARILDWYCSCHPDTIRANRKEVKS
jgi:hypothetical protein